MKKTNKIISALLSIVFIAAFSITSNDSILVFKNLSISASAEATSNGFVYNISNNQITITGYNGTSSQISIPSTINGYSVTTIGSRAFEDNTNISNVTIPGSVKVIGAFAFEDCTNLQYVNINSGVQQIKECAFRRCKKITSITLPSTIQNLEQLIFYGCESLTSVKINSTYLKTIPRSMFQTCYGLTSISIPYTIESIEPTAFSWCTSLKTVNIPSNSRLTTIGWEAFAHCGKLNNIFIPDSVNYMGNDLFFQCTSLSNININPTNRYMQSSTFKYTPYYTNNYTVTKHPNYNLGPAKLCTGKQLVFTIFLEDNQTKFSSADKTAKRELVSDATNKISIEAGKYGKSVNFVTSNSNSLLEVTKTVQNSELTNILNGTSSTYIFSLLDDVPELTYDGRRTLLSHYGADGISYVIFVNRNGRSYSVIGNWEEFNEKSLIYNDSRGSAVVMHEMLHLFGAPDLYTNTYMSQHYNEDIMVKGAHPCMIGPVTAYAIGWVDCILKTEYDMLYS